MRAINITNITTLTTTALAAGDDLFDSCTALQAEFQGCDKQTVHTTLLPMVVAYYVAKGIKTDKPILLTVKEQGSGRLVMTGDASPVSAATKRLNKLVAVITATVQNKVEIDVRHPCRGGKAVGIVPTVRKSRLDLRIGAGYCQSKISRN